LLPTLVQADARQTSNGTRPYRRLADGLTMTDWVRLKLKRKRVPIELGESMMGFPDGHTELGLLEMRWSQKSRKCLVEPS
jgi:hypothetical protein